MKCKNCKHYHHDWCEEVHDDPYPDIERNCKHYEVATNADRIRSMADEELAWFIYTKTGCDHKCMHWKSKSCSDPNSTKVCGEVWLEWLKQECDS